MEESLESLCSRKRVFRVDAKDKKLRKKCRYQRERERERERERRRKRESKRDLVMARGKLCKWIR